jgi:hypothetical protein
MAAVILFSWQHGAGLRLLLVLGGSLLFGGMALLAGMALTPPVNGICGRCAPWVCKLSGIATGGVTAALLCLAFSYSAGVLSRPAHSAL